MKPFFQAGDVVLFQGDSVTDCDRDRQNPEDLSEGYPGRTAAVYKALFPAHPVRFYNRGVSGNRTKDLLERYETDFLGVRPNFVSILIGVNDVWRRYDEDDPTSPEQFELNYRSLLSRLRRDLPETKIMLIEPFLLHVNPEITAWHEDFDPKLRIVRALAEEFADYFIPLDGILNAYASTTWDVRQLSADGVHPTLQGHGLIAYHYLRCLGVL